SLFLTPGVDCLTSERPASSALAAFSSTTPAAAWAAAPAASPATVLIFSALRCAAFTIALRAFAATVLTIVFALQWNTRRDNAPSSGKFRGVASGLCDRGNFAAQ